MSSGRSRFLEECEKAFPSEELLSKVVAETTTKKIDSNITYCTGFTNIEQSSFASMMRYWLWTLIQTHNILPQVRIVYSGEPPSYFKVFPNVTLVPQMWQLAIPNKGVARFNFTMKMQAVMGVSRGIAAWIDADVAFSKDTLSLTRETSFVHKSKRVAGGFYALAEKDRFSFYASYLRQLEQLFLEQEHLNSDQKVMRAALAEENISWRNIGEEVGHCILHLSKSAVKDKEFRERYKWNLEALVK